MARITKLPQSLLPAGVVNRIQAKLPEMPAAMAKIAAFLIEHPQAPLELSIMELAEQTGTSAATVDPLLPSASAIPAMCPSGSAIAADAGPQRRARVRGRADIGRAFGPDDSRGTC